MGEYIDKAKIVEWFRPYGHRDEPIPFETLISDIDGMATADVAPVRHGEWLLKHIGHGHYWECSVCHANPCIYVTENTKFCPNCGAQMDGGADQ